MMDELIIDFETRCNNWSTHFTNSNYDVVFNEHLKNQHRAEIKYILVGDNPGKDEKDKKEYFVGDAGLVARLFFEKFLVNDFDREVISLNKTPISTTQTANLNDLHKKKCCTFIRTQTYMANLLYEMYKILNIPIIICGWMDCEPDNDTTRCWKLDNFSDSYTGTRFFAQLQQNFMKHKDDIFIVKHFSRNVIFNDFKIENYRNNGANHFLNEGKRYRDELFNSSRANKKVPCCFNRLPQDNLMVWR